MLIGDKHLRFNSTSELFLFQCINQEWIVFQRCINNNGLLPCTDFTQPDVRNRKLGLSGEGQVMTADMFMSILEINWRKLLDLFRYVTQVKIKDHKQDITISVS